MKTASFPTARALAAAALAAAALLGGGAQASEREALETLRQTTQNLIDALVRQGVLSRDAADQLIADAEQRARAAADAQRRADETTVRVPYVPETLRRAIADEVREEVVTRARAERWGDVNVVPEWIDRIRLDGDFRFGWQRDMFGADNASEAVFEANGQSIANTREDRDRLRVRARLGLRARVTDELSVQLRLVSGSLADAVSMTQTLGNYGGKLSFALDRAFARLQAPQAAPGWSLLLGRVANPFYTSDLVWDSDVGLDGIALQYADPSLPRQGALRLFGAIGAFPLQEVQRSQTTRAHSKWLYAAQLGAEWQPRPESRARVGLALYDYRNVSGVANDPAAPGAMNATAPAFRQKGNSLFDINQPVGGTPLWALAADYRLLSLTADFDMRLVGAQHLMLGFDGVRNVGLDAQRMRARTGLPLLADQDTGYQLRLAFGRPAMEFRGDWRLDLAWRHLEADAVLDAFADSDFHLGGTNHRGFAVGAQYAIARNTWLSAQWLSTREVSGLPLSIDVFNLQLHGRF
jgi:polyhydroxyalkanoate synthesis regulator phasin